MKHSTVSATLAAFLVSILSLHAETVPSDARSELLSSTLTPEITAAAFIYAATADHRPDIAACVTARTFGTVGEARRSMEPIYKHNPNLYVDGLNVFVLQPCLRAPLTSEPAPDREHPNLKPATVSGQVRSLVRAALLGFLAYSHWHLNLHETTACIVRHIVDAEEGHNAFPLPSSDRVIESVYDAMRSHCAFLPQARPAVELAISLPPRLEHYASFRQLAAMLIRLCGGSATVIPQRCFSPNRAQPPSSPLERDAPSARKPSPPIDPAAIEVRP